jgi:predicted ATPase/class 3 adenylate cyclase
LELPTGTITFLFTDIEGSTRLWERQPDAMRPALERHDAILREAINGEEGTIFRTVGDAMCAAFDDAGQALAAAAKAQRALYTEGWQLETPIRVRIALHSGAAEARDGDYVGASLNRIGRLLPVCHGGQTLLTQATEQLVRDDLPEETSLLDLGQHRFRDLVRPERIFQLEMADMPQSFPPLKTLDTTPNNLPVQLTSFVGRVKELEEIQNFISSSRLLSLVGPGGTGKTRLSLQTAANVLESFSDGAWLVELAAVSDPTMVPQSIAAALNLREKPGKSLLDLTTEYLAQHKLLLILDNCEHLIEACAQVVDHMLHNCPRLTVLVSSRESLGVAGEVTYRVPPLKLPERQARPDVKELYQSESVQLFIDRAQAVKTQFRLTPQNAAAVVQICRRLDGIPLAIELAVARLNIFSVEQIASRLDDRFRLLTGGSRTALPRQQTLQALIDWSYELLSEKEKILLRRLAAFTGGWRIETAEAICAGRSEAGATIEQAEVMDLLSQLVNKSLVLVDDGGEEARFHFLETMRQYASELLVSSGEAAWMRARHLDYFSSKVRQIWGLIFNYSAERQAMMRWLDQEQDNLRLAEDWALEHNPVAALQMTSDLGPYWSLRGYASTRLNLVRKAREKSESLAEFQQTREQERMALLAQSWLAEGDELMAGGESQGALKALDRCIQISTSINKEDLTATAMGLKLVCLDIIQDPDTMQSVLDDISKLAYKLDNRSFLPMFVSTRARVTRSRQGYAAAREELAEAVKQFDSEQDDWGSANVRAVLGAMAVQARDLGAAESSFKESFEIFERNGDKIFMNISRSGLADVARLKGDYWNASQLYLETISNWVAFGNQGAVARCLECLAFIAAGQAKEAGEEEQDGLHRRAANLLGATERMRQDYDMPMSPEEQVEYEGELSDLRGMMPPEELKQAWEVGRGMDLQRAIGYANQTRVAHQIT